MGLLLQSPWLQTGDCYCGRSPQTLKCWIPMVSTATGRNRKRKLDKALQEAPGTINNTSTIPLSSIFLQWQLHNSPGEYIPVLNYPQHWKASPDPMPSAVCSSQQASWEDCRIFAVLHFWCAPKHHSPECSSARQQPGQLLLILYLRNWF